MDNYQNKNQTVYQQPTAPQPTAYRQPTATATTQQPTAYRQPTAQQATYQQPAQPVYQQPAQPVYQQPAQATYQKLQQATQPTYQQPQQSKQPQVTYAQPQQKAPKQTNAFQQTTAASGGSFFQKVTDFVEKDRVDGVISVREWFFTWLLTSLPIFGLILLFLWAFKKVTIDDTKANYAKFMLIIQAVIFLVSTIMTISAIVKLTSSLRYLF